MKDLDTAAIEAFRSKWMEKSGNRRIKNDSVKELLMNCGAITDHGITYAALILFGTHKALGRFRPQAEIVFEYRSSYASGPPQQREDLRMGFFSCYDHIWELINLRNDKQHYQEGLFIFDIPTFNERVVREALLNAVCHRNYQLNGSVFVRQYRDRLLIESPGGLPLGVTLDNILYKQSPRNRLIAEILSRCGLVERSGQGMNLIYEWSIKEAKPLPDFTGTDDYAVCITLNGLIIDKRMLSIISKIGSEHLESFTTSDFLVINALFHDQKLDNTLCAHTKRLVDLGIIENAGRNKYILSRRLYAAMDKSGVHTRQKGLDRETNKALILKHIQSNGAEGTPFKEFSQVLPSHSRDQIQSLLKELKKGGFIAVIGKTSAARWFLK